MTRHGSRFLTCLHFATLVMLCVACSGGESSAGSNGGNSSAGSSGGQSAVSRLPDVPGEFLVSDRRLPADDAPEAEHDAWFASTRRLQPGDEIAATDFATFAFQAKDTFSDADLQKLSRLSNLTDIYLNGCRKLTDTGVASLATLKRVRNLNLSGCPGLTVASANIVSGFDELETLGLLELRWVNDDVLAHLKGKSKLKSLSFSHASITDDGIDIITSLSMLERLHLNSCMQITEAGVEKLKKLKGLKYLSMADCTTLGPASIEALKQMTSLHELDLTGWFGVDDTSLLELAALPRLKRIGVAGCPAVTEQGIERVKKKYPELSVSVLR